MPNNYGVAGDRENAKRTDFEDVLTEELAAKVKEAAEVSMGCEVGDDDLRNMQNLCTEVSKTALGFFAVGQFNLRRNITLAETFFLAVNFILSLFSYISV